MSGQLPEIRQQDKGRHPNKIIIKQAEKEEERRRRKEKKKKRKKRRRKEEKKKKKKKKKKKDDDDDEEEKKKRKQKKRRRRRRRRKERRQNKKEGSRRNIDMFRAADNARRCWDDHVPAITPRPKLAARAEVLCTLVPGGQGSKWRPWRRRDLPQRQTSLLRRWLDAFRHNHTYASGQMPTAATRRDGPYA